MKHLNLDTFSGATPEVDLVGDLIAFAQSGLPTPEQLSGMVASQPEYNATPAPQINISIIINRP